MASYQESLRDLLSKYGSKPCSRPRDKEKELLKFKKTMSATKQLECPYWANNKEWKDYEKNNPWLKTRKKKSKQKILNSNSMKETQEVATE